MTTEANEITRMITGTTAVKIAVQRRATSGGESGADRGLSRSLTVSRRRAQKYAMTRPFAWSSGVGRGGVEPPTFRFQRDFGGEAVKRQHCPTSAACVAARSISCHASRSDPHAAALGKHERNPVSSSRPESCVS